jgi:hypothetical protein
MQIPSVQAPMTRPELLTSARHKLRLAAYHAEALLNVLELHPTEDLDDERRIEMEAHLEGLAYTGTAAAEKALRSIDPEAMREQMPIHAMILVVSSDDRRREEQAFGRSFQQWWYAAEQVAVLARDLRNDAAHRIYEKAPNGSLWRMEIGQKVVQLDEFAERYRDHLGSLAKLVDEAEQLAGAQAH